MKITKIIIAFVLISINAKGQQAIFSEKMIFDTLSYQALVSGIGTVGTLNDKSGGISFQVDIKCDSVGNWKLPVILRNATSSLFKDISADSLRLSAIVFPENYNIFFLGLRPSYRLNKSKNQKDGASASMTYFMGTIDVSFNGFRFKPDTNSYYYVNDEVKFYSFNLLLGAGINYNMQFGKDKGYLSLTLSPQFNYFSLFRDGDKNVKEYYSLSSDFNDQPIKTDFIGFGLKFIAQLNDFSISFEYKNINSTKGDVNLKGLTGNQINFGVIVNGQFLKF